MGNIQHKNIANDIWQNKSFLEQMSNIGSEVYRAINWKENNNEEYSQLAFNRSLELFDLSKQSKLTPSQFKELCRMREIWVDYFKYDNKYKTTKEFLNNYFMYLTVCYKNKSF